MTRLRGVLGVTARVLFCALAIACGATIAAATTPPAVKPIVVEGLLPTPMVESVELASTSTSTPTSTTTSTTTSPSEPRIETDAPFARSLANGMVMTGATRHRLILFTFDDGPDHRYTRHLLDALDRERIRAVFFLAARRFEGSFPRDRELASIAQEIVLRGHFVGNHTMDHLQLPLVTNALLDGQITAADAVFERVLGERTFLVRPPGGGRSARVDAWMSERGYTQMLWNLGTGDFQVRTSDAVLSTFRAVLEREQNERGVRGGIVLLHDIHSWSVEAFPRIVGWLEDQNCALLDRGEEVYDFVDDPSLFFVARGDQSPSAEAPFAEPPAEILEARQARARARAEAHCSDVAMR